MSLHLHTCQSCISHLSSSARRLYATAITLKSKPQRKKPTLQARPLKDTPEYPYGPALFYKQRDSGLYGGTSIQHGFSRTEKKAKKHSAKSHRVWHPNIQRKRIWSDALQEFVRLKVQMRVLRTIDKVGGLDNYVMGNKPARIKELGMTGWNLRWRIMGTRNMLKKMEDERETLGLPREGVSANEEAEREKMRRRADRVAYKYVKAQNQEDMEQAEKERQDAEHQLLADAGEPLTTEDVQPYEAHSTRYDGPEQSRGSQYTVPYGATTEPQAATSELQTRIINTENNIDDLALQVARDTLTTSPSLPLPNLSASFLLAELERIASIIGVSTDELIERARGRIHHETLHGNQDESPEQVVTDEEGIEARLANEDAVQHIEEAVKNLPYEYHEEIDMAIPAGSSTTLALYNSYLDTVLPHLAESREAYQQKRLNLANQYLRQLRTKNSKGGKGVYKKKSAWDTCFKKAVKNAGEKPTLWNTAPSDLTLGQWQRLYKAGKEAKRERGMEEAQTESVKEGGDGEDVVGEKEQGVQAWGARTAERVKEGARGWMNEKELSMFDRIMIRLGFSRQK